MEAARLARRRTARPFPLQGCFLPELLQTSLLPLAGRLGGRTHDSRHQAWHDRPGPPRQRHRHQLPAGHRLRHSSENASSESRKSANNASHSELRKWRLDRRQHMCTVRSWRCVRCPVYPSLDQLPDQFRLLLDRLPDHFASTSKLWFRSGGGQLSWHALLRDPRDEMAGAPQ